MKLRYLKSLKHIPSRTDRVIGVVMPVTGLLLPWVVAVGVTLDLQARGEPTWPWSSFATFAIPGLAAGAVAAAPLVLLAFFHARWALGDIGWVPSATALERRLVVLCGFAGCIVGLIDVFVGVCTEFAPALLLLTPYYVLLDVPWLVGGLVAGVGLAVVVAASRQLRTLARREAAPGVVAKRVSLHIVTLAAVVLAARAAGGPALRHLAASVPVLARGLVAAGVSATGSDQLGRTALMAAAKHGDASLVTLLLDHGADPNARMRDSPDSAISWDPSTVRGATALHAAVGHARVSAVEVLLARGSDPNASDAIGQTPLMLAAECGRPAQCPSRIALVKLLLAAGADPNVRGPDGKSALAHVKGGKDEEDVRQMLRQAGGTE